MLEAAAGAEAEPPQPAGPLPALGASGWLKQRRERALRAILDGPRSEAEKVIRVLREEAPHLLQEGAAAAAASAAGSLQVGQRRSGKVVKAAAYGAFVDIGEEKNGLVPRGKMWFAESPGGLSDAELPGKEVQVWVSNIRPDGAFELTMRTPVEFLKAGVELGGVVRDIASFGAFVDVGAEKKGLVPLSKMVKGKRTGIEAAEVVQVGQKVCVWVSDVKSDGNLELTLVRPGGALQVGDAVEAARRPGGSGPKGWHPATVQEKHPDGTVTVRWRDFDGESRCNFDQLRKVKSGFPVRTLQAGQQLTGEVVRVLPYGVFVDVGADRNGLVPESRMAAAGSSPSSEGAGDLSEFSAGEEPGGDRAGFPELGQEVQVWVSRVGEDGSLELSMVEDRVRSPPPGSSLGSGGRPRRAGRRDLSGFVGLSEGEWLPGTVTAVQDFGAFVHVLPPYGGSASEGLLHVSQIDSAFVAKAQEKLQVGQDVLVRVIRVDEEKNRMFLSMLQA